MPEEQKKEELHVPYAAYKDTVAAQERHVGRLIYVIVLIVVFFFFHFGNARGGRAFHLVSESV